MNAFGIGKSGGASSPDSESLAETAGFPFEEMGVSLKQFSKGNKDRASHRIFAARSFSRLTGERGGGGGGGGSLLSRDDEVGFKGKGKLAM